MTVAWNNAQHIVLALFRLCTGLDMIYADAIFFTLTSDVGQRQITSAVAGLALSADKKLLTRLRAALNGLDKISHERNAAIHTMWVADEKGRIGPIQDIQEWIPRKSLAADFEAQFAAMPERIGTQSAELMIVLDRARWLLATSPPPRYLGTSAGARTDPDSE